jgi:hypothetical protein
MQEREEKRERSKGNSTRYKAPIWRGGKTIELTGSED